MAAMNVHWRQAEYLWAQKKSGHPRGRPDSFFSAFLGRRDPRDHGLREPVYPPPRPVSDAVLVRRDVDHVGEAERRLDLVVALLVREDDQAVAPEVDLLGRLAEIRPGMRLARHDGLAQREAAAGRDLRHIVGEGEDLDLFAD